MNNRWTLNKPMALLSTCHLFFALDGILVNFSNSAAKHSLEERVM